MNLVERGKEAVRKEQSAATQYRNLKGKLEALAREERAAWETFVQAGRAVDEWVEEFRNAQD